MTKQRSTVTTQRDRSLDAALVRSGRSASWFVARVEELRIEFLEVRVSSEPPAVARHGADVRNV